MQLILLPYSSSMWRFSSSSNGPEWLTNFEHKVQPLLCLFGVRCPFLDPHQTTHHSHLGVWSRKATELSPHTSGACKQCKAIHFTTWPQIQWFLHWFPTLKPGQCFTYTGFQGWPCKLKGFNLFGGILQGKGDMSQPMSLNSALFVQRHPVSDSLHNFSSACHEF